MTRALTWLWASALAILLVLPLGASEAAPARTPVKQVYLIQNSGWMEPFYADPRAQFRQLLKWFVSATRLRDGTTMIATFNQNGQLPGHQSPESLYSGSFDRARIETLIDSLAVPRRPDGKYPDSDFHGALKGAIESLLQNTQAIIWMVTNNKDSPNNSQEVVTNTRGFYDDLRRSRAIAKIVAFPVRMVVTGPNYNERGFIIYGIAYGNRAAQAMDNIIRPGGPLRRLFAHPPVRLKPLDQDPVELRLSTGEGHNVTLDRGIITVDNIAGGETSEVELRGSLVNSYYPQQIVEARLSVHLNAAQPGRSAGTASIMPMTISNLGSGKALKNVTIRLTLPHVERKSIFQDRAVVDAVLEIRLNDARLALDPEFVAQMHDVFGIDILAGEQSAMRVGGLPAVFFDYQRVNAATTIVPIRLMYIFSPWPMILMILGGILLVALLGGGGFLLARPREYLVRVGSSNVRVKLRPFQARTVQGTDGTRAMVRGMIWGRPSVQIQDTKTL